MSATSSWGWLYFVTLVFLVSFFGINLVLAIIADTFTIASKHQKKKQQKIEAMRKRRGEFNNSMRATQLFKSFLGIDSKTTATITESTLPRFDSSKTSISAIKLKDELKQTNTISENKIKHIKSGITISDDYTRNSASTLDKKYTITEEKTHTFSKDKVTLNKTPSSYMYIVFFV